VAAHGGESLAVIGKSCVHTTAVDVCEIRDLDVLIISKLPKLPVAGVVADQRTFPVWADIEGVDIAEQFWNGGDLLACRIKDLQAELIGHTTRLAQHAEKHA